MSYDIPARMSLDFDVAVANLTKTFRLPKGTKGRIGSIIIQSSATYNAVTTGAFFQLGVVGDLARYANVALGTLAAGAALDAATITGAIVRTARSLAHIELPADTDIVMTFVANTGGTPAGAARATVNFAIY